MAAIACGGQAAGPDISASGSTGAGAGGTSSSGASGAGAVGGNECTNEMGSIQSTIFVPTCGASVCHDAEAPAGALDLSSGSIQERLVGVGAGTCDGWKLVVPGDPDASFLYQKLTSSTPACGDPMPIGLGLSAESLACIREWIVSLGQDCERCGGSDCIALGSDPMNCGACGNGCPAGVSCVSGACTCPNGGLACGGECVDAENDALHCGGCDRACAPGATCTAGECSCPEPLSACGDGCVDLTSNAAHCGACDTACGSGEACLRGECSMGCGDLSQCGTSCVDLASSFFNCGECGHTCQGELTCQNGACACAAGTACGDQCVDAKRCRQLRRLRQRLRRGGGLH